MTTAKQSGFLKNKTGKKNAGIGYTAFAWPPDLGSNDVNSSVFHRHPQYVVFYFNVNSKSKAVLAENAKSALGPPTSDFTTRYYDLTVVGADERVDSTLQNRATSGQGLVKVTAAVDGVMNAIVGGAANGLSGGFSWLNSKFDNETLKMLESKTADIAKEVEKQAGLFSFATYKRFHSVVVLPMPLQFRVGDQVQYDTGSLGGLAGMAVATLNNPTATGAAGIKGGIDILMKQIVSGVKNYAAQNGTKMIGAAGRFGEKLDGIIDKARGQTDNNRKEQVYGDNVPRTFTFSYQLAPKNQQESVNIQAIIQMFREHMRPELSALSGQAAFMTMPSEFDITMYTRNENGEYERNTALPRISTCVLETVDIDYTPNGLWVSNKRDGSPQMMTMTLTFKEIEPIHRTMVEQGY